MTWYKLVFEQKQPIHVGYYKYGVLNQTRIFIPGWTMWGALTKTYNIKKGYSLEENQDLFQHITCFFPSFDGEKPLEPCFKYGEFYFKSDSIEISEREFRILFTSSMVSTAVLPECKSAKDESLHELEFILPKPKEELKETELWEKVKDLKDNLKWIGYLYMDDSIKETLEKDLKEIFIGGDVRYGFGLMKLIEIIEENPNLNYNALKKGKYYDELNIESAKTILKWYYLKFNNQKFYGKLELIPEFEFYPNIKVINANFYLMPGCFLYKQ